MVLISLIKRWFVTSDHSVVRQPLPAIDLLSSAASSSYFETREHEIFYAALKTDENRRDFHDQMIGVCQRFLEVTSDPKAELLVDHLVSRVESTRSKRSQASQLLATAEQRHRRGCKIMGLSAPLTLDSLKRSYRIAALKHHPDRGGIHDDMIAINEAYTEIHTLLIEEHLVAEGALAFADGSEDRGDIVRKCWDYRYKVWQLLLSIYIDDWSLDEAFRYLQMFSSSNWRTTPYTKNVSRTSELHYVALELTERLARSSMHSEARSCVLLSEKWAKAVAKEREHMGDAFVYGAMGKDDYIYGARKILDRINRRKVVLKHIRQAKNALRLGVIDQKRYEILTVRFAEKDYAKRVEEGTQERVFHSYTKEYGFLQTLPPDGVATGKVKCARLVPEPGYYCVQLRFLTDDQQAEYVEAFGTSPVLVLTRKYLFVRLQSLLETAILYDSEISAGEFEREARLLGTLKSNNSKYYAQDVADTIVYLARLDPKERTERLRCLRALHANPPCGFCGFYGLSNDGAVCNVLIVQGYFEFVRRPLAQLREEAEGSTSLKKY